MLAGEHQIRSVPCKDLRKCKIPKVSGTIKKRGNAIGLERQLLIIKTGMAVN